MSILDSIVKGGTKLLLKESKSLVRSTVRAEIKKKATKYISKFMAKSEEELAAEAEKILGFATTNYKVEKNKIVFKPSQSLIREWLLNSSDTINKLVLDEETGKLYFNNNILDNSTIKDLSEKFCKITNIKTGNVFNSFGRALKTLDPQDLTARNLVNTFNKWNPSNPSVIDSWMERAFGSVLDTDKEYCKLLFKKWIVGTARRAINPGSSLDGCLTLQGPSGSGKTRFFREIMPPPFEFRTGEIYCKDIKSPQKFVESILGKTVACFDELSILQNVGVEDMFKQLLSTQNVDVRLAWRRDPQRYALRQGFAATSNSLNFIKDPALGRRLWVIKLNDTGRLDFDFVRANREMLWNEAIYLAKTDFPVHLSFEEQKQVEEYNKQFHQV